MASTLAKRIGSWKLALAIAATAIALAGALATWQVAEARTFIRLTCADSDDNLVSGVSEGDNARINVAGGASDGPHTSVWWYTEPETDSSRVSATRDEDYEYLYAVQQDGPNRDYTNYFHRDIATVEDVYPELTEYFKVRIGNKSNESGRTSCSVEIVDDDRPGIYKAEITSRVIRGDSYRAGDTITLEVYFNTDIYWVGDTNRYDNETSITLMVGDTPRRAVLHTMPASAYQKGTNRVPRWIIPAHTAIELSYKVQDGDLDKDGISIQAGSDDSGWWELDDGSQAIPIIQDSDDPNYLYPVNTNYRGILNASDHKVDTIAEVERVSIDDPDDGEAFQVDEGIVFNVHFDKPVRVTDLEFDPDLNYTTSAVTLDIVVGDTVQSAEFLGGSGGTNIAFLYRVQFGDMDANGVTVPVNPLQNADLLQDEEDPDLPVDATFEGIIDVPNTKVDGRVNVKKAYMVSRPANGDTYGPGEKMKFTLLLTTRVTTEGNPGVSIRLGEGDEGVVRIARESPGESSLLNFYYTVKTEDKDTDGATLRGTWVHSDGSIGGVYRDENDRIHKDGTEVHLQFDGLSNLSDHKVDGSRAYGDASVISSPANGHTYGPGESIDIAITFGPIMNVQGTPEVSIKLGEDAEGPIRRAKYLRGSGEDTLVFRYDVESEDSDDDGLTLRGSWVHSDGEIGGTYYDEGEGITTNGIRAPIYFDSLHNLSGHKVDGSSIPGDASIISSPANGDTYREGETIEIALNFGRTLDVEGTPAISIRSGPESGGTVRQPQYLRGSGTDTLVFGYKVKASDLDDDGVTLRGTWVHSDGEFGGVYYDDGDRILLNGASIPITFDTLENVSGHKLDGRPYVKSMALTSTPASGDTYGEGEVIQATVTFNRDVEVGGTPTLALALSSADGELHVVRMSDYVSGSGAADLVFEYTVQADDVDNDGVGFYWNTVSGTVTAAGTDVSFNLSHGPDQVWDVPGHKVDGSISVDESDTTAPTFVSAQTDEQGETVTLTFSEEISFPPLLIQISDLVNIDPFLFVRAVLDVYVDGELVDAYPNVSGSTASEAWSTMGLTVLPEIGQEQTVTVSYDNVFARDAVGLFIDNAGNALEFFSDETVTNNSSQEAESSGESSSPKLVLSPSTDAIVTEGDSLQYDLSLSSQPEFAVTVHVVPFPDSALEVSPSSITIEPGNWDQPQTVTLTAIHDDDVLNFWERVTFKPVGEDVDPESRFVRVVIKDDDETDRG